MVANKKVWKCVKASVIAQRHEGYEVDLGSHKGWEHSAHIDMNIMLTFLLTFTPEQFNPLLSM